MLSFYETGFYQYGRQQAVSYNRHFAKPVLRDLVKTGKIDTYPPEVKSLNLFELKQSFFVLTYAYLVALIIAIGEIIHIWNNLSKI